jgi:hypothetical protein
MSGDPCRPQAQGDRSLRKFEVDTEDAAGQLKDLDLAPLEKYYTCGIVAISARLLKSKFVLHQIGQRVVLDCLWLAGLEDDSSFEMLAAGAAGAHCFGVLSPCCNRRSYYRPTDKRKAGVCTGRIHGLRRI